MTKKAFFGPLEDDGQGPWQSEWSWRDIPAGILGATSGAGNALYNIGASLAPFEFQEGPNAGFSPRIPPVISEPINALSRLSANSFDANGNPAIPDIRNVENQQDVVTGLLSLYGGNALNPLARVPKGAVASGAVRDGGESASLRAYHGSAHANGLDYIKNHDLPGRDHFMWSSSSPDVADVYAATHKSNPAEYNQPPGYAPNITPVDLEFKNPYVINNERPVDWENVLKNRGDVASIDMMAARARDMGHDGLIVENVRDSGPVATTYAALQPNTVRSATTGEVLFSDNRPSLLGSAVAGAGRERAPLEPRFVDPNSLIFREPMQDNVSAIKELFQDGDYPPIVTSTGPDGQLILDGHNRTQAAIERGHLINALDIPWEKYLGALSKGWDETDIAHAALSQSGLENAAYGIRQKFPGIDFFKHDDEIGALFSDTGKPNPLGAAVSSSDQPQGITAYHDPDYLNWLLSQ